MTKNLDGMLTKRPVNRKNVDTHKKRMLEEVRSYGLRDYARHLICRKWNWRSG